MKLSSALGSSLLVLLGSITAASADHRRQLDDLAFAALSDSRDIRWYVRDHFTQSSDLRHLCRESDDIFATARNLQDAIFRGRTLPIICRNIEKVQTELYEFEELLQRCDFARHSSHRLNSVRNSYSFAAGSRHAGHGHVEAMQHRIDQLKQTLEAMHAIAHGDGYVVPQSPVYIDPPQPTVPRERGPRLQSPLSKEDHRHQRHAPRSTPTAFSIGRLTVTLGN